MTATDGTSMCRLHADTPLLSAAEYTIPYSMHFFLRVQYTDGTSRDLYATGFPSLRSAADVATMALEDPYYTYTPEERAHLNAIATTTS